MRRGPVLTSELHEALRGFVIANSRLRRLAAHPQGSTASFDEAARKWDEAGEKVLRAANAAGIRGDD